MTEKYTALRVQCPHCPTTTSGWPPAVRNHAKTHAGGMSRGPRQPNCGSCGVEMHTATQPGPHHSTTGSDGNCQRCTRRLARHAIQPPGTPRARAYRRELLVAEIHHLRAAGVTDYRLQAVRLGVKPLSLRRALARAYAAGLLERSAA